MRGRPAPIESFLGEPGLCPRIILEAQQVPIRRRTASLVYLREHGVIASKPPEHD